MAPVAHGQDESQDGLGRSLKRPLTAQDHCSCPTLKRTEASALLGGVHMACVLGLAAVATRLR
eukprot:12751812-Alexandrium_andersonii.AAC.1